MDGPAVPGIGVDAGFIPLVLDLSAGFGISGDLPIEVAEPITVDEMDVGV